MSKARFERNKVIPGILGDDVICDIFGVQQDFQEKKRPAIVFVHGGGFVGGDKDQFLPAASWLALNMDILCITMQYRLAPEFQCPAPMIDCLSVFQWIKDHQEELNVDLRLVFVAGGSPGANIGTMAMFAKKAHLIDCDIDPEQLFLPDNGIFLNGIYDLTDFYYRNPEERGRVLQYLGIENYDENLGNHYSPVHQNAQGKHILMLHGSKDVIVPVEQCERMKAALESCGNRAEIHVFEGKEHAWFNRNEELYEVLKVISNFIEIRENEVLNYGTEKTR